LGEFTMKRILAGALACAAILLVNPALAASVTLYDQDFESPNVPFVNGFGSSYDDLSQQQVNDLYGGQPAGFSFAQRFTVETMLLTGSEANGGSGYNDTTGKGENYAVGMLCCVQDDRLGLSFDVGGFDFFNFKIDVSSVALYQNGGGPQFTSASDVPIFRFTLYDNPTGATGLFGNSTVLDTGDLTGVASALDELVWTTDTFAFDTTGSTNGNVTLSVDLIQGGYAVFDNWLITASDDAGGGLDVVPLPASLPLLLGGLAALAALRRRT
jgi:hypothetical protein